MISKRKFVGFRCLTIRKATKQIAEIAVYHLSLDDFLISITKDIKNDIAKKEVVGMVLKSIM